MTTIFINCLFVDDYSHEDAFKIEINENETVRTLMEAIKKRKIGFDGNRLKFLKVDLSLNALSDKLALLEAKSFSDIKTFLGGKELLSTMIISECFNTKKYYIIIDPPFCHFTFKRCVNEKKLITSDKIIYHDNNGCLEGIIVNISNRLQIRCTKDHKEYYLDSFSKFIKLAISLNDIESKHWKNLLIELYELKEKLTWRDFCHRMLNRNLEDMKILKVESTQWEENAKKNKPIKNISSEKENALVILERDENDLIATSPKKMAKTEQKHDADNIAYNRIHLIPPRIKSPIVDSLKFFTIDATISYGTSTDKHTEVEQLYNLLVEKKDCIDRILESQPVYFIGPSFHGNYNFPCITCWVTAPLSQSTLEQLESIYDGEFKAVYEMMETTNYASSSNSGSNSSGSSSTSRGPGENKMNDKKKQRWGKKGDDGEDDNKNNDDSDDSDDDGGGDGDDGGCSSDIKDRKKVITVSSKAFAESEGHVQEFSIRVHFYADICNDANLNRFLLINTNVIECRASALLNQNWKQLSNCGSGYFLESVAISFSPITDVINNRSELFDREYYFPKMKNRSVENSVGTEKQGSLEIGQSTKAGFQIRASNNTKVLSDEWHLKTWGGSTTGDNWMYEKKSIDQNLEFEPGSHISKWLIIDEKMRGFCVNITQVFCFKFNPVSSVNKLIDFKSKLVMCPKVSHTLKMSFNDLEDFNDKFMLLEHFHRGVEKLIVTVNNNARAHKTTKINSDFINIERSVINEKI